MSNNSSSLSKQARGFNALGASRAAMGASEWQANYNAKSPEEKAALQAQSEAAFKACRHP